jgi:GH25 family lysozyme M1 (1,4-beta-N-acetylmuramidase)
MAESMGSVKIEGDASGNVIITGHSNHVVIVHTTRIPEPEQTTAVPEIGRNPYKGLAAFQEKDADYFFGREALIEQLWERFRSLHEPQPGAPLPARILPILGPSGSGKSSVARAGLIPGLARRSIPGRESARVAVCTPGAHPLEALSFVLAGITARRDEVSVARVREMVGELKLAAEDGKYDGLRRIVDAIFNTVQTPLIILVDQFEEVYSLCDDPQERHIFVNNLLEAASDRAARASVILTLRTDFIGETNNQEELSRLIAAQGVLVPVMSRDELRRAIAEPARRAGHPLDEATVDLLVAQSKGREGVLPLLQFALTRIWEGMAKGVEPDETLRLIEGVGGALAVEAQRLYDSLQNEADKAIARRAFLRLIRVGKDIPTTRRTLTIREIVAHHEDAGHVKEVLNRFASPGARILTLSAERDGTETARITHEALLEHWTQLQRWIEEARNNLLFQDRLEQAVQHWKENGMPRGLLWRPPDLDRLRDSHKRSSSDMTALQIKFFEESEKEEAKRRRADELFDNINRWRRPKTFIYIIPFIVLVVFLVLYFEPSDPGSSSNNGLANQASNSNASQNGNLSETNTGEDGSSDGGGDLSTEVDKQVAKQTSQFIAEGKVTGVDVSSHNDVKWEKAQAAGISFAFIRASFGETLDPKFKFNWQASKRAGVIHGAYHILQGDIDAARQAETFLQAVQPLEDGDLPPTLDFTVSTITATSAEKAAYLNKAKVWLEIVGQRMKRKPIVYVPIYFREMAVDWLGDYSLWIAQYHLQVSQPDFLKVWEQVGWTFWQYSDRGRIEGFSGDIDHNVFNGSYDDLLNFIRRSKL